MTMRSRIDKAFISFRIGITTWLPEARFNEQLALFDKYKGVTDEVTLFTGETHPCLPLAVIRERAKILALRMDEVRRHGYRTGINLLATIGHHNENLSDSLAGPYTLLTDIDGKTCDGCRCPNDGNMRDYIRDVYRALAEARPDYIWIDDDVRLFGHTQITAGCFCDTCMKLHAAESGEHHTRESLKVAFNSGETEQKLRARKAWLAHNRRTIARLLELIERSVHAVAPGVPLGFMTGDRFFEGYAFEAWAERLAGPDGCEVMWRPGGGFYSDEAPIGLVGKSHDIGRQVSGLPSSVVSIQSEIENFPYQRLKKAAHTTALEAASHIAAGCTGAAFNVLQMYDEPLDEYEPLVAVLHKARPFYDLMAKTLGRSRPQGLWAAWSKDSFAAAGIKASGWPVPDDWSVMVGKAGELFEIGLPAAYSLDDARVTALTGDAPLALSESELRTVLSRGVYMDGPALERLNAMGYGEYTGFTVARYHDKDCIEEMVPHGLNGPLAGRRRDNRQSFVWWNVPAAELVPTSPAAQPLSRLVDYGNRQVAACSSGVFENALGGRICVAGYFPWTFLQNCSKSAQLKSVFRWLGREALPGYVASYHKINLWVREVGQGRLAAALINTTLDAACNVELMLRTPQTEIGVHAMSGEKATVRSSDADGTYRRFVLPALPAWQMMVVG
ncbi:MAG: hypothetical protein WCL44_10260 [bacterium]